VGEGDRSSRSGTSSESGGLLSHCLDVFCQNGDSLPVLCCEAGAGKGMGLGVDSRRACFLFLRPLAESTLIHHHGTQMESISAADDGAAEKKSPSARSATGLASVTQTGIEARSRRGRAAACQVRQRHPFRYFAQRCQRKKVSQIYRANISLNPACMSRPSLALLVQNQP
jgi:hypothetical protein